MRPRYDPLLSFVEHLSDICRPRGKTVSSGSNVFCELVVGAVEHRFQLIGANRQSIGRGADAFRNPAVRVFEHLYDFDCALGEGACILDSARRELAIAFIEQTLNFCHPRLGAIAGFFSARCDGFVCAFEHFAYTLSPILERIRCLFSACCDAL
jgi:hypothetical protein